MKKKILNFKELNIKLDSQRRKKKTIVLCHGVFDVLHIGHINHFKSAKDTGDILVVSVTPDRYVKKGPNRPIFTSSIRMKMLSAIEHIDYIVENNTETAVNPINIIKPNIYCKGKDYKKNKEDYTKEIYNEIKAIKKINGKIIYTKDELYSSSSIINSSNLNLSEEQKKFISSLKITKRRLKFDLPKLIDSFKNLKVLLIGETIIDEYDYCETLGKSGKEPVLAVKNLRSKKFLGGVFAIAKNLSDFCKKISVLTYIGEKREQINFIYNNLEKNIKPIFIKKKGSCTIVKKRIIDDISKAKILGIYSIEDHQVNSSEELKIIKILQKQIKDHDLIIVSDYGHGLISKKISKFITTKSSYLAVNTQLNAANIGHHNVEKYKSANLVIINENEMRHEMRNKSEVLIKLIKETAKKLNCKIIFVTSGNQGVTSYKKKTDEISKCPAFANKVVDKIGAGDTMLAFLSLCNFKKINIELSLLISSLAAAINVENEANSKVLKKIDLIKASNSYLK